MTYSPFDSPIYGTLYGDNEVRALFTDSAEVRAILLVEGALAKVQGDLGVIPLESALYIHRASMEVQIDPAGLATGMAETGSPVSALVAAFAKAMEAPEHSKYINWGANSQDIIDTALVLRLRQYLRIVAVRLEELRDTVHDKSIAASLQLSLDRLRSIQSELLAVRFSNFACGGELSDKTSEIELELGKVLKLPIPESTSNSIRSNICNLVSEVSKFSEALEVIGREEPESLHSVTLATMALFTANQSKLIRHALDDQQGRTGVNLALEKLVLGQACIAGSVALKHALILANRPKST